MPTELIHTWQSQGRTWQVLHRSSTSYLRTDGRMVAQMGSGLSDEEAINQAYLATEVFQINERQQEMALLPRLFEWPQSAELKAVAKDYEIHEASFTAERMGESGGAEGLASTGSSGHLVYAAFNHNAYAFLARAEAGKADRRAAGVWEFIGCYASAQEALAALPQRLAKLVGAEGIAQPPRLTLQRKHVSQAMRREAWVIAGTAIALPPLFALAWGFQWALKSWPWLLVAMCAAMFVGCAVALWWQRRQK